MSWPSECVSSHASVSNAACLLSVGRRFVQDSRPQPSIQSVDHQFPWQHRGYACGRGAWCGQSEKFFVIESIVSSHQRQVPLETTASSYSSYCLETQSYWSMIPLSVLLQTTLVPIVNPLLKDGTLKSRIIYVQPTEEVNAVSDRKHFWNYFLKFRLQKRWTSTRWTTSILTTSAWFKEWLWVFFLHRDISSSETHIFAIFRSKFTLKGCDLAPKVLKMKIERILNVVHFRWVMLWVHG